MIRHIAITLAATLAACGLLIALPDSLTSQPVYAASVTSARAAECETALANALPELVVEYRELCAQGYAIEGATGRAYGADMPACKWEDGSDSVLPCKWDAAVQGNGQGTSVIVTTAP